MYEARSSKAKIFSGHIVLIANPASIFPVAIVQIIQADLNLKLRESRSII